MKKKKRYIVILVGLAVYVVIMLLALGDDLQIPSKDELTLIVEDSTIWSYSEGKWLNITNEKTVESLNWLDYNVYIDNKKIGDYYLWNDDSNWYIFDDNKQAISKDGTLLAYRSNYDIKIKNFSSQEIRNYYHVTKVLQDNNLNVPSSYELATQTTLDIDNDGQKETFYFVSNAFPIEGNPDKVFSFVFMVKNSEIYPIYSEIDKNEGVNGCRPFLTAVLDIDKDNKYEMVISCRKYSIQKPVVMLYKLTEEGFKIIISNQ